MKKFRFWWFKHVSSWLVPEDWVRLGTTHNCQPPSAPERNFQVSHGFHPDGMKSPALGGLTMSLRETTLERPVCPAFVGRFFPRYSQSLCFPYTYSHFLPLSDNTSKWQGSPIPSPAQEGASFLIPLSGLSTSSCHFTSFLGFLSTPLDPFPLCT